MFDPGDGTKMRTINSRTRYTTMPYKYEYNKNVAAVTYKPDLLVLDYHTFIGVGTATATVYKTWH
ncbi:hypothetical protein [Bacillus kwashiorkori]|uniref:hypothetical protein n=1 Tax=Bacillus kwashiorkori TaxID=1522318 RepID=UPI000783363F|nr:hypothetical protein [Bacillus kwashiorkori]